MGDGYELGGGKDFHGVCERFAHQASRFSDLYFSTKCDQLEGTSVLLASRHLGGIWEVDSARREAAGRKILGFFIVFLWGDSQKSASGEPILGYFVRFS